MSQKKYASEFLVPFQNQWVAMDEKRTRVIESDADIKKLDQKIRQKKLKNIIVTYVRRMDGYYAL